MARIRSIKPEFFHDPDLADVSVLARLTFIGLWCYADRAGRLKDEPRRLRGVLFPYEQIDLVPVLDELERGRFIQRYEVNGGAYLQIRTFTQHQMPHVREPATSLPDPPELGAGPVLAPDKHSAGPVLAHARPIGEGREGNGSGKGGGQVQTPPPPLAGRRNEHAKHALCGPVCVPDGLWRDMVEARAGDDAYVTAYVHRVWDSLGADATRPLDRFKFWRERWDADHPPIRATSSRAVRAVPPGGGWTCPHTPRCERRWACERKTQTAALVGAREEA